MIRAVLLDLDDTLISSRTQEMFAAYLEALGQHIAPALSSPEQAGRYIIDAYVTALTQYDPIRSLAERFFSAFSALVNSDDDHTRLFNAFYAEQYAKIVGPYIQPRPEAHALLNWLADSGLQVVVATNPGLPLAAIEQRLEMGGIAPQDARFDLVTALETMHFGKPQPEYFHEILIRLDLEAHEAIMVGNDWEDDIKPALSAGLHTYWVESGKPFHSAYAGLVDAHGSLEHLLNRVQAGWLDTLQPRPTGHEVLIQRLAAFPAGVAAAIQGYPPDVLECAPADHEWSARDIICHLRDHDAEEDRKRLQRILDEENPFLSANYDPWAHAHQYIHTSARQALEEFVRFRTEMVQWLASLPAEVWARPARYAIFGPTWFGEMVRFATEHDRTHLRQIRAAIRDATLRDGKQ